MPELVKIEAKRTLLILHLRKIEAKRILFIPQIRKKNFGRKKCLRRLSQRYKKKMPAQAEPALKKTVKTGKIFTQAESALTICLRRVSLR
jgi:hypothetical protein